jgi:menaquinone-dependent protoporphyrinogen oxidase
MRILLAVASKHGSTYEIADRLAKIWRLVGHSVDVVPPEEVSVVHRYDAVIIGSAVYAGRWRKDARRFVDRFQGDLLARPTWLFSSGPVGDPLMPDEPCPDGVESTELLGAREHKTFSGKIDVDELGFAERAIVRSLNSAVGDYRNWGDVTAWAHEIAVELAAMVGAPPPTLDMIRKEGIDA